MPYDLKVYTYDDTRAEIFCNTVKVNLNVSGTSAVNSTYSNNKVGTRMLWKRFEITGNRAPNIEVNMMMNSAPTLRPSSPTSLFVFPQSVAGAVALLAVELDDMTMAQAKTDERPRNSSWALRVSWNI